MARRPIFEWWRRGAVGWWHEVSPYNGKTVNTGGQRFSRHRDAKRAATKKARRVGGIVRERKA